MTNPTTLDLPTSPWRRGRVNPAYLALLHKAERTATDDTALHLGLSDDDAAEHNAAMVARRRAGGVYEVDGHRYRAEGRIDALMQHEDLFGVLASLCSVVEIV